MGKDLLAKKGDGHRDSVCLQEKWCTQDTLGGEGYG